MKWKVILGCGVLVTVAIILALMSQAPVPPGKYPSPNAYTTYLAASAKVASIPEDYFTTSDVEKLRESVEANRDVLGELEQAASQDCVFPLGEYDSIEQSIRVAGQTRRLAHLMMTKVRLERLEGKPDEAGKTLADSFVLASRLGNGGLLVHQLSAISGKRMAMETLKELAPELSSEAKTEILGRLESVVLAKTPIVEQIEEVMEREIDAAKREKGIVTVTISKFLGGEEPAVNQFRDRLEEYLLLETDVISRLRESATDKSEAP